MIEEHTVVYDMGGSRREVTREVFTTSDGRVCGTEYTTRHWFEGEFAGWRWRGESPVTQAFETLVEAREWVDAMLREHEVWRVSLKGGTRLVIV